MRAVHSGRAHQVQGTALPGQSVQTGLLNLCRTGYGIGAVLHPYERGHTVDAYVGRAECRPQNVAVIAGDGFFAFLPAFSATDSIRV